MIMITPIDSPENQIYRRLHGNNTHVHGGQEPRGNVVRGNVAPRGWDPIQMWRNRRSDQIVAERQSHLPSADFIFQFRVLP